MKPQKTKRDCLSPEIRALVKKRYTLRRHVKEKREEWLEATRQVRDAFSLQREEWVEYLEELVQNPDCSRMWKMVESLSGRPDFTHVNEAMNHKGKTITSNMKAGYPHGALQWDQQTRVTKEERDRKRDVKNRLRDPWVNDKSTRDFSMKELTTAIKHMITKDAAGPDDIPPTFLKALGQEARKELLDISNESLNTWSGRMRRSSRI